MHLIGGELSICLLPNSSHLPCLIHLPFSGHVGGGGIRAAHIYEITADLLYKKLVNGNIWWHYLRLCHLTEISEGRRLFSGREDQSGQLLLVASFKSSNFAPSQNSEEPQRGRKWEQFLTSWDGGVVLQLKKVCNNIYLLPNFSCQGGKMK